MQSAGLTLNTNKIEHSSRRDVTVAARNALNDNETAEDAIKILWLLGLRNKVPLTQRQSNEHEMYLLVCKTERRRGSPLTVVKVNFIEISFNSI